MVQLKKITAGVCAALALGYGTNALAIPAPGAVADALLNLANFTLLAGDGALGRSIAPLPIGAGVTIGNVITNADVSANVNGGVPVAFSANPPGIGALINLLATDGGAGFVAATTLPFGTLNPNTYAGSATSSFGNALDPTPLPGSVCGALNQGDCIVVHNQINLTNFGEDGSAQANQNLIASFSVTVGGAGQLFEMAFDATGFLRTALGQPGISANAAYNWFATIREDGVAGNILNWSPNSLLGLNAAEGSCVTAVTCTEYSDAFDMSNNIGLLNTGDIFQSDAGSFEVEAFLAPGTYTFTITHNSIADANIFAIPEPTSIALIGLGMLGIGAASRRRKA